MNNLGSYTLEGSNIIKSIETVHKNIHKYNDKLNAYVQVYESELVSNPIDNGRANGLLVSIKDLICYKDHPIQASSKILEGFVSEFSATCVQRLIDNGSLIVGHTNCDEFGMGSSNENSCYGPVHNGLFYDKVPGGSSGGAAVSVQMDMCHVALGTDTGGSVRQPASFCGIIGLKPTYGLISRHGVIAHSSSLDTVGILGKYISDILLTLKIIAGRDDYDCTTNPQPLNQTFNDHLCNIAYLIEPLEYKGLQKEIHNNTTKFIDSLRCCGHHVEGVNFKYLDYVVPTYYTLSTAEASSNLARYDGVRYGLKPSDNVTNIEEWYKDVRSRGFGYEVKKRILFGNFVLSGEHYEEYYVKALKVRRLITDELLSIFDKYDYIVLPTTPTTAFGFNHSVESNDPLEMCRTDIYTVLASIAGLPAISIPYGVDNNGLPIGIQIIGKPFCDCQLLNFADKVLNSISL